MKKKILTHKMDYLSLKDIKLIVYDFDGVLTDNKVIISENGNESVVTSRADGLAIGKLKSLGISQIVISTEKNKVVDVRMKKLGLLVIKGVKDKRDILINYCKENNILLQDVAFIGNDLNDLEAMKLVGYPICPSDAYNEIKEISKIVLRAPGGKGIVRELIDFF